MSENKSWLHSLNAHTYLSCLLVLQCTCCSVCNHSNVLFQKR